MSGVIVGILSQIWLRRYHRGWYKKYNYILGGALDGGTEMMVLILAFAVFGAAGIPRPFPSVRSCTFVTHYSFADSFLVSGPEILDMVMSIIATATTPCDIVCSRHNTNWV
jgi:hypothetical protein